MIKPYSDEFMIFDEDNCKYVLTEKDVLNNCGINLQERLRSSENPQTTIKMFLTRISMQVYRYIHQHNVPILQDYIISISAVGRKMIKQAMEYQLIYILSIGDLSLTAEEERRKLYIDDGAKELLINTIIPEVGTTICYTGELNI